MSTLTPVINATLSRSVSGMHLARDHQRALRAEGTSPGEATIGLVRAVFLAGGVPEDNDFSIHVSHAAANAQIPTPVLVDLLDHASAAARIAGCLDAPIAEQLTGHIDAIAHRLAELLGERPPDHEDPPNDEERDALADALDELRRLAARAETLASTTDEQFSRIVVLEDGDDRRGFRRLAHLVELTASAVAAASDASDRLIATIERNSSAESA